MCSFKSIFVKNIDFQCWFVVVAGVDVVCETTGCALQHIHFMIGRVRKLCWLLWSPPDL